MLRPDTIAFETRLAALSYQVETKTIEPSLILIDHTHDVDILGLVTKGEITITVDGKVRCYSVGDEFVMPGGQLHSEVTGTEGVTFIVGRRALQA